MHHEVLVPLNSIILHTILTLKLTITSKFHDYLYGNSFVVFTDNNPMTYVSKSPSWTQLVIVGLSGYDFRIKYRPGKANVDADALPGMPQPNDDGFCEINPSCVQACCQGRYCCYVTSLVINATLSDGVYLHGEVIPRDWRRLQYADPMLGMFSQAVGKSHKPLL